MPCKTADTIEIKTGSLVDLDMVFEDDEGAPIPLDDYTIDVVFKNPKTRKELVHCSTENGKITITDAAAGAYTVDAGHAVDWPLGKIPLDIKYTVGGKSRLTDTFYIEIVLGYSQ